MNNLQAIKRLHRGKMAAMLIQRREGCYAAPDGTEFRWDDGSHKSENHARHAATVYTAKWLKEDSPMQPPEKSRRDDFARPVVGKNGLNVNIYANLRSDDDMKKLGFTDYGRHWDYSVMMTDNISFHLHISKQTKGFEIHVYDDCMEYDYQAEFIRGNPSSLARRVRDAVQEQMEFLVSAGIIGGYNYGDYI